MGIIGAKLSKRKKVAGIVSIVLVVALLLTTTYAWQYNNLHKTADGGAANEPIMKSVMLVDESQNISDWTVGQTKTKRLFVKNDGKQEFEDVYVRIVLKEYMERKNDNQEIYQNRLMVDENGAFISYDTKAEAEAAYPGHTVVMKTNALGASPTAQKWFIETKKDDKNGQYGNFMTTKVESLTEHIEQAGWYPGSTKAVVPSTSDPTKYPGDYHTDGETEECDYVPVYWDAGDSDLAGDDNTRVFRSHVTIGLNPDTSQVKFMSDFTGGAKPAKGEYWLIDDTGENQYAYWMQPLAPGQQTKRFTETLTLKESPNGYFKDPAGNSVDHPLNFFYALHADLEPTLVADYTADWPGISSDIENALFASSIRRLPPPGQTFTYNGVEWIVLAEKPGYIKLIMKNSSIEVGNLSGAASTDSYSRMVPMIDAWWANNNTSWQQQAYLPTHVNREDAGWLDYEFTGEGLDTGDRWDHVDQAYVNGPAASAGATVTGVAFVLSYSEASQYYQALGTLGGGGNGWHLREGGTDNDTMFTVQSSWPTLTHGDGKDDIGLRPAVWVDDLWPSP